MDDRIISLGISLFCMFMGGVVVYLLMCAKTVIEDTVQAILELIRNRARQ